MVDSSTMAKVLRRFAEGVAAHDRENPDHHSWGIGMAYFDIERLGLEEGEEILPGIVLQADGHVTGNFRILCDGQHDGSEVEEEEAEIVDAVASEEIAEPVYAPASAPPVRPPL
jgi:hypothetical protein